MPVKVRQGTQPTSQYVQEELKAVNKQETVVKPQQYEEHFHSEWALVSLVLGIMGLVLPLFSPLAIVSGVAAFMQTHRDNMKGRWMAIVGMILGFIGIIATILLILIGLSYLDQYLAQYGGVEVLLSSSK